MQYIKKQNTPPPDWDTWFTTATGIRSFDYGADYGSLTLLANAKQFLIDEQHSLCAYCQQKISMADSSIEHVIPKEHNKELSTNYYNLVAVCKTQVKDVDTGKYHCDKEKGSKVISSIIFTANSDASESKSNAHFVAYADGTINPKHTLDINHKMQIQAFINILNLNHRNLKEKRVKEVLDGLISVSNTIPQHKKSIFWKSQFRRFLLDKRKPFRQFILTYIGNKIGVV